MLCLKLKKRNACHMLLQRSTHCHNCRMIDPLFCFKQLVKARQTESHLLLTHLPSIILFVHIQSSHSHSHTFLLVNKASLILLQSSGSFSQGRPPGAWLGPVRRLSCLQANDWSDQRMARRSSSTDAATFTNTHALHFTPTLIILHSSA